MYANLPTGQVSHDDVKLEYNYTDKYLLDKFKAEAKQSLHRARVKLFGTDDKQPINAVAAFAAALPQGFLISFNKYLRYSRAKDQPGSPQPWSFNDIISFILCEKKMRLYNASASELKEYGVSKEHYEQFRRVRIALSKADVPFYKRPVHEGARAPANTFDPVIAEGIEECNKLWTSLFFVSMVSACDLDDDKQPNSSPSWKKYGMRMQPTKEKKLKPVFHLMAVIGAGYICWMGPDMQGMSLGDMLKRAINHVCPSRQAAVRAMLDLFIDRGYLELAKAQGLDPTNLIQIMEGEGVKFLGTMKDSLSFAFQIVDVNNTGERVVNNRPVVQAWGIRTNFVAHSGKIQASVMRHGANRVRGSRIATNMVNAKQNIWVYETSRRMTRLPIQLPPRPLGENASRKIQIEHAWEKFLADVIVLTLLQRTVDWFLARLYCFSSTSFHASVNVKAAAYINTESMRTLHARCLQILRLHPRNTITVQNAVYLEDEDLPIQRGHLGRVEGTGEEQAQPSDEKCTTNYWLRGNKSLAVLKKLCDDNNVEYNETMQRKHLAEALAKKYQSDSDAQYAALLDTDVPDDDVAMNKLAQVCLLQRMLPRWFMKPFASQAGGAIEQGTENESSIISVLQRYVKKLSKKEYDIHKVREFGLLANRKHRVCTTSPDGVFPLLKRNGNGEYDFVSLCALEMKTRGTENTTDALIEAVLNGGEWGECVTDSQEFEDYIPDPSYRSQVSQHATALNLDYVMIVFSLPGALVKKIVLVTVSAEHRGTLLKLSDWVG